jgi:hypothetical protein
MREEKHIILSEASSKAPYLNPMPHRVIIELLK